MFSFVRRQRPYRCVELHDAEPPIAGFWEDVVEVSFRPVTAETLLLPLEGPRRWRLDLEPRDHRVRYCAYGWDYADDDEDTDEQYLLQFWPGPPAEDRIVRQESRGGQSWHTSR